MTFTLDSPDGDQGFPGDIHIELTYTLTDDNELHLDYKAAFNEKKESALPGQAENSAADDESKAALETPLNLTNHSYFNLNGHDSGTVLTQEVWIDAEYFTEADRRSIPTGTLLEVKWTPMDFRKPKALGKEINADYEQLKFGGGYDHNFVLGSGQGEYREVASMYAADSGIKMTWLLICRASSCTPPMDWIMRWARTTQYTEREARHASRRSSGRIPSTRRTSREVS